MRYAMTANEDAIFREMLREQERLGLNGGSRKLVDVEKRIRIRASQSRVQQFVDTGEFEGTEPILPDRIRSRTGCSITVNRRNQITIERKAKGTEDVWTPFTTIDSEKQVARILEKGRKDKVYEYRRRP